MQKLLLLTTFAALAAGCAPAVVKTPCVPNPVTLGPVTRVATRANHAAPPKDDAKIVKEFEFEPLEGNLEIRTSEGTSRRVVSGNDTQFSTAAMTMTEGRGDRDLRITSVPAGSYVMVGSFGFYWYVSVQRWIQFEGNVSEVRHAH